MIARVRRRMVMYPRIYADAAVANIHSMRDFDQHIVARYGGFADADDYYYSVASSHYAGSLRVPTLIVHSLDDPFIRMLPETRDGADRQSACDVSRNAAWRALRFPGGGRREANGDGRWAEKTLLGFLTCENPECAGDSAHGS